MNYLPALVILAGCAFGFASSTLSFTRIDLVVALYELTNTIETMTDIQCQDDGVDVDYIASRNPVANCPTCFQVYPSSECDTNADFCLKYLPIQTISHELNERFLVTVTCRQVGNATNTVTAVVEIRLIPNVPPVINSAASVQVSVTSTENIQAGQAIHTVLCTDRDSDAIDYSLSTNPAFAQEFFYIDTTGIIRANKDLIGACFSYVTFEVTCSDRRNPVTGPVYIHATLNGANESPIITGLNFNLDIPEDEPIGTTLSHYTVSDDDSNLNCLISTNPLNSLQYYEVDSLSSALTVRTALDYEEVATRNLNLTLTCNDNYCTSEPSYIYIRVTDVNEPMTLLPAEVKASVYEGMIVFDPEWQAIDPDVNDRLIYTITGGNVNSNFRIDANTGILSTDIEYDVDQLAMPSTDFIVVTVTDLAGHTQSSTVSLSILDFNDNPPVFSTTNRHFTITDCTSPVGTIINTAISATDRDSALDGNNNIVYSSSSTGPFAVVNNGDIAVSGQVVAGNTYTIQITATDQGTGPGGSKQSNPHATVTVFVQPCPSTTAPPTTTAAPVTTGPTATRTTATRTTTTRRPSVGDSDNSSDSLDSNLGWIIFAGLLATVFLAALAFMLWRYCAHCSALCAGGGPFGPGGSCTGLCDCDCCAPRPPRRAVIAVRGPQPPGGNPEFWKERYPNDDYWDFPNRDRIPTPAPMEGSQPLAVEPAYNWRHDAYY